LFANFRLSFAWLHTRFGLVLGFVVMAAFFFGSLSVFDREIGSLGAARNPHRTAADAVVRRMILASAEITAPEPEELEAASKRVTQPLPDKLKPALFGAYTTRDPVLDVFVGIRSSEFHAAQRSGLMASVVIDPRDGRKLPEDQLAAPRSSIRCTTACTSTWYDIGIWIVGWPRWRCWWRWSWCRHAPEDIPQFFTFRPGKKLLRAWNAGSSPSAGVVARRFHFLWALSGHHFRRHLFSGCSTRCFSRWSSQHGTRRSKHTARRRALWLAPGTLASVDTMMIVAKDHWVSLGVPGEVGYLQVTHVGSSNAYVSIYRDSTDRVATAEGLHFQGSTGHVIFENPPTGAVETVNGFLTGMHLQQFKHWTLRWLIFAGGLVSCVCIATGFIFFVEKRKHVHAKEGTSGSRWVDALAVTTVTGMIVATLATLV
jgi:hypothetical protein